tara:strand:- start:6327 stop:6629 length:303 start_codon:yes stop_codon:yes gene_type:complete
MNLETQIEGLIKEFKDYGKDNLPVEILRAKAVVEIVELIQKNIEVLKERIYFNKMDDKRTDTLNKCMIRLEQRKRKAVNNILKPNNNATIQAERFYSSIG